MAKRSLKSSATGILKAKQVFDRKGWTQEYLSSEVGLSSRQSVWKFFTGRPIERYIFKEICFKLDLEWEDIADLSQFEPIEPLVVEIETRGEADIDTWTRLLRERISEQIQSQCNILQSAFDLTQPFLEQIYVFGNVLPQLSNQRWLEVADLQQDRFPSNRESISALKILSQQDKLMILGKPGSGKSTFLQYIALQCDRGKYKPDLIPIFQPLRTIGRMVREDDDHPSLVKTILSLGERCGLSTGQTTRLLEEGRFLLLLDGFDEVSIEDSETIFRDIDQFARIYYKNTIYITCRVGIEQYSFRGFTYVELADFDSTQIEEFAQKWFIATARDREEGIEKAERFFEQLERPINQPIRDLGVTPILLNLLCSVFKEKVSFPTKRSKLYQVGLEILLQKWDQARGIQRDRVYRTLSLVDKIKLLSQIAATTFERNDYFFESDEILYIIEDYLKSSPVTVKDTETLWLDSEALLKAIELQHGLLVQRARDIYSFSHLTFQEYLTARKIVASPNLEEELKRLANHAGDPRWREVILLTVNLLPKADFLLEKIEDQVKSFVENDPILSDFLSTIEQKVKQLNLAYNLAAVRAFYFNLLQNRDLNLAIALDFKFASMRNLPEALTLDLTLARAFTDSLNLLKSTGFNEKKFLNLRFALDLKPKFTLDPALQKALIDLKQRLPDLDANTEKIEVWWRENGQNWVEYFRTILIQHRSIGHDWQLTPEQVKLWQKYYQTNEFLIACIHSDCQVSTEVRKAIEDNLLLPEP